MTTPEPHTTLAEISALYASKDALGHVDIRTNVPCGDNCRFCRLLATARAGLPCAPQRLLCEHCSHSPEYHGPEGCECPTRMGSCLCEFYVAKKATREAVRMSSGLHNGDPK